MRRSRYVVNGFGARGRAVVGLPNNWAVGPVERFVRCAYLVRDGAFGPGWDARLARTMVEWGEDALRAAGYLPAGEGAR